jgi:peroxiredoxin Q/BCP
MNKLEIGDNAPSFSLEDQEGRRVRLTGFKGRKLLVFFYPKAMTPGCTRQACAVGEALGELEEKGVAALGISPDAPERQKRFADKHGLAFPLLADEDHAVAKAYGAWGTKSMYGKKYEGVIRSSFLVDEKGRILGAWYKVKPGDTVPKALEVLGE